MKNEPMDDIQVNVATQAEAQRLQEDFQELLARVNADLTTQSMICDDPLSVDMAVYEAELCVDHHLVDFLENPTLQRLAPDIKMHFANSIREQAKQAVDQGE